ncbi:DUF3137 domain-containing protein [Mesomycoplasma ovipneumoniae]|uniref:DUF3137 domain-containing protein n=1 Tax=Mesomycoplasma ovipneumoniae TaxID=29562 RepID=UPI00083E912D|nr:DUF3137 domain-containing protein [Mesomycoplasma ovipneumoniae]
MKIVNDYLKFKDYKNKTKEEFRPKLDEMVELFEIRKKKREKIKTSPKFITLQKESKKLIIISSISIFLTFIIILIISLAEAGNINLIFAIVPGIVAFFSTFRLWSKKKEIWWMTDRIPEDVYAPAILRPEDAYKTAFSILDKRIDYLDFNDQPYNKIRISWDEIRQFTLGRTFDWRGNRDSSWPEISSVEPLKELLIDKKFRVAFTNVHWEWEEIRQHPTKIRSEDVTIKHHISTGILKIDTSILGEKAFDFKLLRAGSRFSKDKVRLENEEFNEVFDPESSDKLKIRKMYTPYAMELSLKRYFDRDGIKVSNVSIESSGNAIYITYKCNPDFMSHVFRISSIKSPDHFNNYFIRYFFDDFLADAYSLYYLLSLIYPTLYLD